MSFVGGKLKLKGGEPLKGGVKKKKKHSGAGDALALVSAPSAETLPDDVFNGEAAASGSGAGSGSVKARLEGQALAAPAEDEDRRTEAEKKYDERYEKDIKARQMKKMAGKSHRERIKDFNEYLSKLSEHHDLFKISGGARKG